MPTSSQKYRGICDGSETSALQTNVRNISQAIHNNNNNNNNNNKQKEISEYISSNYTNSFNTKEFRDYLQAYHIPTLLNTLTNSLLEEKPTDVIQFILKWLKIEKEEAKRRAEENLREIIEEIREDINNNDNNSDSDSEDINEDSFSGDDTEIFDSDSV